MPRRKAQQTVIYTLRAQRSPSPAERLADGMTNAFGSSWFFIGNGFIFVLWILWNLGWIPGLLPFDPYPFGMLTMVVSLEAIFLSIIVLMSQNRAAKVAELREEIDFQVNVQAEREIARVATMLERIEKKLSTSSHHSSNQNAPGLDLERLEEEIRSRLLL